MLPSVQELAASPLPDGDWVWVEIEGAPQPYRHLVGQRMRLTWQDTQKIRDLVALVTTDIRFSREARQFAAVGGVLPERLDGRRRVGPLQSLAGARPNDDLIVSLEQVAVASGPHATPTLRIGRPPIQISGRYKALVRILGPDPLAGPDRYRVQHFDRGSARFSGPIDSVRIPRQPPDRNGRRFSSPEALQASSAGFQGWYLYGAPDAGGVFTVQAIQPRALVKVQADQLLAGSDQGLRFLRQRQWDSTYWRRGRIGRVQILPNGPTGPRTFRGSDVWQPGAEALIVHVFGGIGGAGGELGVIGDLLTSGHFSFGMARVVRDPLSGEPVFDLRYYQIYVHNTEGIVSGTQDWTAYIGDLQRGWLGTRPISDLLIRLPVVSQLTLGSKSVSPLRELAIQSEVMMARYRSGDGTGVSILTPSVSCVQDSSQALYITLQNLRRRIAAERGPAAAPGPASADTGLGPEAVLLAQAAALADGLDTFLKPTGIPRPDWESNRRITLDPAREGSGASAGFRRGDLQEALLSRHTFLPRRAYEELARLFLVQGADLWVLRSNQVPGTDTSLKPIPPSLLEP
jgi:predicted Abi (CAAX) family protease